MKMKTIFILKNKNALYRRLENMKRRMIMAMAAMYTVSCMAGCGSAVNADAEQPQGTSGVEEGAQAGASADPIQVVTTIFPEYDWVKTILGDQTANAEITMLLDNGVDLHSFEPTAEDIMKISDCDMFVYVGGESDEWVTDVLRAADNKDMVVINLLDVLGERVKEEEIVEGMEHDHDHEHEHEHEHEHSHEKREVPEDRTLSDYEGEWQSLYPFMNENFKAETASYMAEAEGFEEEEEAWNFFYKGNETDVRYVNIKGDEIEFIKEDGTKTSGTYEYDGYYSDCWGETSIRYQFKNTDTTSEAPAIVQFDDHLNYPTKAEHFHIYCGEDGTEMLDIMYNWPTYYPADITSEEDMIHEFLKHYITEEDEHEEHDHEEDEHEEHDHEEHDHEEHEEGEHEHEEEMDEHVWLSLKNTQLLCDAIADGLGQIDAENAEEYKANASAYKAQLSELDAAYAAAVNEAGVKTLLFGDHFPFRYMVDDYGLSYYAAFAGCSAEAEASFDTIMFLAEKTDELGLSAIMTIEGPEHKIAEAIRDNTEKKDQQILTLDSMQGTTSSDVANGVTYLSVMTQNLKVIKEALQ